MTRRRSGDRATADARNIMRRELREIARKAIYAAWAAVDRALPLLHVDDARGLLRPLERAMYGLQGVANSGGRLKKREPRPAQAEAPQEPLEESG